MNEIRVTYNTVSPRRQEYRDRMQLLGASISIVIGYSETFKFYTGITIILPIIGFVLVFLNVLFARFYRYLIKKYGAKFELLLIRANGIIMLITGIGYQVTGSKYIQYAYYLLAVLFFIILPNFLLPAKKKRLVLQITRLNIIIQKRFRTVRHTWQEIDLICIQKDALKIKTKGTSKLKNYFLEQEDNKQIQMFDFIDNIKSEHNYNFEIQMA